MHLMKNASIDEISFATNSWNSTSSGPIAGLLGVNGFP
jgi:hypothetical protein